MVSKYNTYIKLDRGYAITNGLLGTIDLCDDTTAENLMTEHLSAFSGKQTELLTKRGYLYEGDETERMHQVSDHITKNTGKTSTLTLIPSYNCNFRCPYCFEAWRLKNGSEWLTAVMSRELVDSVFSIMDARPMGTVVTHVCFFGGEPFLPRNKEIVKYILEQSVQHGVKTFSAISNGYYLDQYMDLLENYKFNDIQLTLDGSKEVHDSRRYLAGGGGTYDVIIRNIDLALQKKQHIVVRMNVDETTADEAEKLRQEVRNHGWLDDPNFTFYCANVYCCDDETRNKNHLKQDSISAAFFKKGIEEHKKLALRNTYCYATKPAWTVDPFGDVYTCLEQIGEPSLRFAHISENGLDLDLDRVLAYKQRTVDRMKDCNTCPVLFYCGGGCMAKAYIASGDFMSKYCFEIPHRFENVLKNLCSDYLKHHAAEQTNAEEYLISLTEPYL